MFVFHLQTMYTGMFFILYVYVSHLYVLSCHDYYSAFVTIYSLQYKIYICSTTNNLLLHM